MFKHLVRVMLATCLSAMTALFAATARADGDNVTVYVVDGEYADVLQDTADAIVNRGFKIDHRSYVGDMLARTGAAVGSSKKIYTDAQLLQFCSAVYSRRTMEANPANIAYCPYVIFVYERADKPGTIHVGFRRLDEAGSAASRSALAAVNAILDAIVREGAGMF
jgi:uncharacterized protein (DUF302 family)